MTTIAKLAGVLQAVLPTPAEAAAAATGFVQRRSKLTGAAVVQTLVFGWLATPVGGVNELSRMAGALGVSISRQGLDQRVTVAAAAGLQQVLATAVRPLVTAEPVALPILRRFAGVYVQDRTPVALPADLAADWPGCGNASPPAPSSARVKRQVRLDLTRGELAGPVMHLGRVHDRAAPVVGPAWPAGALLLADLGSFSLGHLRALADAGLDWLTRLQGQTRVVDVDGRRLDRRGWLRQHAAQPATRVDVAVTLGAHDRLPARLVAVGVPPEVGAARRRQLHAEARRRGQPVSRDRLTRADWTILGMTVPLTLLSARDALVLARARWQIDLLCKLWTSQGQLATSRSRKPARRRGALFAKLLALLAQHWLLLGSCWRFPVRPRPRARQRLPRSPRHRHPPPRGHPGRRCSHRPTPPTPRHLAAPPRPRRHPRRPGHRRLGR